MRAYYLAAVVLVAPACYLFSNFDNIVSSDASADAACPTVHGPTMVAIPNGTCIDSTEVTLAQYKEFVDQSATPQQTGACAANTTFTPSPPSAWPPNTSTESLPVTGIDWCDAFAFCAWSGKRLCGRIGGGSNATSDLADPAKSQWFAACSHEGARAYPYGNNFDTATCNGGGTSAAIAAVATFSECVGGYNDIFDMSGNVAEWEDSCDGDASEDDGCLVRGGSFNNPTSTYLACDHLVAVARGTATTDKGFRCCSP